MSPYNLDKGQHSVYSLYYHFIQVVKYRKKVFLNDAIVDFLKMKIREISETFNVDVLDIECDKDHSHNGVMVKIIIQDVLKEYVDSQEAKRHEGL